MSQYTIERGGRHASGRRVGCLSLVVVAFLILAFARSFASYAIEIEWWKELGQFNTWLSMLYYSLAPSPPRPCSPSPRCGSPTRAPSSSPAPASANTASMRGSPTLAPAALACFIAAGSIDTWTVVRFAGSRGLPAAATAWHDAVFNQPLSFYLFDLPFYSAAARLRARAGDLLHPGLLGRRARLAAALPLPGPARRRARSTPASSGSKAASNRASCAAPRWSSCWPWPSGSSWAATRWSTTSTAASWSGIDYVDQNIGLPLQWLVIFACLAAAGSSGCGRWLLAGLDGRWRWSSHFVVPRAGLRALRAAQRDLAPAALHPDPHPRHAQRLRPRTARQGGRIQGPARSPDRRRRAQAHARQRAPLGLARRSTTPSPRSRRCAPTTSSPTPTWTATPSTASTARCCSPRASSISASSPTRAPAGSTRTSSTPTATALVLRRVSQITAGRPARAAHRKRAAARSRPRA